MYRLPVEAEWEYAARAGREENTIRNLDDNAWWGETWDGSLHPVGLKKATEWGLFDMLGNASELIFDFYYHYPNSTVVDPEPTNFDQIHMSRGCSSLSDRKFFRFSYRNFSKDNTGSSATGFRILKEIKPEEDANIKP